MKLWKILLATMIALVLVCAVAMAEETKLCENGCLSFSEWTKKADATCTTGSYWEQYKCNVKTCPNNKVVVNTKYADDKLRHTWDESKTIVTPATCTEDGGVTKYCKVCKNWEAADFYKKTGHAKNEVYALYKDPTCTEAGYHYYQCGNNCGYEWKETIPATGDHSPYLYHENAVDPTCTEAGYTAHDVCWACGKTFNKVVLPKIDHSMTWWTSLGQRPTCTTDGVKVYKCDYNCGETKTEVWPAWDHAWIYVDAQGATCTTEGHTGYKYCNDCKVEVGKDILPKKDHAFVIYVDELSKHATCTEAGYEYYQCSYGCGNSTKVAVAALGHDYGWQEAVPAKCYKDGYTAHDACTRTGCKATLNKEVIPATGKHDLTIVVNEIKATCLKEGSKILQCSTPGCYYSETKTLEKAKHDFTKEVPAQPAVCGSDGWNFHYACSTDKCTATQGKVVIPAAGAHKWEKIASKCFAATCTKGGYEWWECTKDGCDAGEKRNEVAKLGHDVTLLKSTTLPTCTTEGTEVYKCSRCDDATATKTVKIAKLPHNYVEAGWSNTIAPTCTTEGLAERYCTFCAGAKEVKTLAALGHKMAKNPDVVKAPECTKDGEGYYACERCSLRETTVIKALGHKEWTDILVEADCEYAGMKRIWCDRCKKVLEKNIVIPALGHKGKVIKEVAPTCTTEGSKTTECTRCEKTVTEKIAKLAHQYSWVTAVKPSAAGNGRDEYKCALCGDIAKTETVKYSKWYYNNTITSFGPMTRELVGGNDWYRVTPVDLTVDGVYTYDLIASNKYIVGKVTIAVNAGTLTVSYKANGVDVKDEALLIYASKADLATGTAVTAPVGAAINAAETFGADTKVLVSLVLTGDYDAAGKGLVDASAAAGMIANID